MQLTFPTIVGVTKEGKLFISDNYIGHGNLGLSDYEMRRAKELSETKPTKMEADPATGSTPNDAPESGDIDLDFDDL